jgi:hypothetical protein
LPVLAVCPPVIHTNHPNTGFSTNNPASVGGPVLIKVDLSAGIAQGYDDQSMRFGTIAVCVFMAAGVGFAQEILIPRGAIWRFWTDGSPATNWHQPVFNDGQWPQGRAQLGYGEGDEQTNISEPGFFPFTTYLRRSFTLTNPAAIKSLTLRLVADDGALVFLNGRELTRKNLPLGPVAHFTAAVANIETNENTFVQLGASPLNLRSNDNTIGVELHQHGDGVADGSFDLELIANIPVERPVIEITKPANGAGFSNGPIVIETMASDASGHVTSVEFYTNGTAVGVATMQPFVWIWTNPPPGRYAIFARARNHLFYYADSSRVHVQVGPDIPIALRRGPYLQSGSSTGLVVRWRTDGLANSVLRYGIEPTALDIAQTNLPATTEHEVTLGGLQPDTLYYYGVGTTGSMLASGPEFHFRTAPEGPRPTRIWIIGDSGTADLNAAGVRDGYAAVTGARHTDVWLMLGDNAYGDGWDIEYQHAVFDMYPDLLRRTVLWPTIGNHDAGDDPGPYGNSGRDYLAIFTLPAKGEGGGSASGTELYYSFDYANIHFVCLDSYLSDRSAGGAMLTWLRDDLARTGKDWIVAFWHHPPYSWGGHNSDDDYFQIEMRERVLPILDEYGVDLVFTGHSHTYERSKLLNGHYGYSWQLEPSMVLDGTLGRTNEAGAYRKPAGGLGAYQGAVYAVCGCSGQGGDAEGFPLHPAMATNHGGHGSMVVEISDLRLTAEFVRPSGTVEDYFTIDKTALSTIRPRMEIARGTNGVVVSWPTSRAPFGLQWAGAGAPMDWLPMRQSVGTNGRRNVVVLENEADGRLFRLEGAADP